ncbi:MAG: hypothetical protein ACREE7_11485 [Dongiaceae bacterium]
MRAVTVVSILVALCLSAGAAQAQTQTQSEDEAILRGSADEPPAKESATVQPKPARAQSTEDDELDDEELDEQVFYSGFGIDRVTTDFDNLGDAINLQAVMGFRIPTVPWFGVEIDIGQTIIPGTYRDPRPAGPPCTPVATPGCGVPAENGAADAGGDEFGMQALGLSLAFKSSGRFYVTGRYGVRYIATSNDAVNENRSGNGLGLGVGYRWGRGQSGVELAYKQLAEDVESVGLTFFVRAPRR